jgi:two-component system, OmpR family, response regulator
MKGIVETGRSGVPESVKAAPNILVVEDEPGIGWALRRLLEQAPTRVTVAVTGAGALEHLGRQTFSAIFLDVKLPDADGFELAGIIKAVAPATPIVMISAYFYPHDPKVQQMLLDGIARRFISKPFRHDEVIAALRDLVVPNAPWSTLHSLRSTAHGARPHAGSTPGGNSPPKSR